MAPPSISIGSNCRRPKAFAALVGTPDRYQAASLRLVHRILPKAAAGDRGPCRSGYRKCRTSAGHPVCRILAADRRQLLGPRQESPWPCDRPDVLGTRWERDHANDKKPVLAAALETAFDPAKNIACIGLDQLARNMARSGCRPVWPMPIPPRPRHPNRNPTPTPTTRPRIPAIADHGYRSAGISDRRRARRA